MSMFNPMISNQYVPNYAPILPYRFSNFRSRSPIRRVNLYMEPVPKNRSLSQVRQNSHPKPSFGFGQRKGVIGLQKQKQYQKEAKKKKEQMQKIHKILYAVEIQRLGSIVKDLKKRNIRLRGLLKENKAEQLQSSGGNVFESQQWRERYNLSEKKLTICQVQVQNLRNMLQSSAEKLKISIDPDSQNMYGEMEIMKQLMKKQKEKIQELTLKNTQLVIDKKVKSPQVDEMKKLISQLESTLTFQEIELETANKKLVSYKALITEQEQQKMLEKYEQSIIPETPEKMKIIKTDFQDVEIFAKISARKQEIQSLELSNNDLQSQLEDMKISLKEETKKGQEFEDIVKDLKSENELSQKQIQMMGRDKELLMQAQNILKNQVGKLSTDLERSQKILENQAEQLGKVEEVHTSSEYNKILYQNQELQKEVTYICDINSDLESKIEELLVIVKEGEVVKSDQNLKISNLEEEKKNSIEQTQDLEKEIENLQGLLKDLNEKLDESEVAYQKEVEQLSQDLTDLSEKTGYQSEAIIEQEQIQRTLEAQIQTLNIQIDNYQKNDGVQTENLEQKDQLIQSLHQKVLKHKEIDVNYMKEQLQAFSAELTEKRKIISGLQEVIQTLEEELAIRSNENLKVELEEVNEKCILMQDLVIGWQRRFNELEESTQEEIFQLRQNNHDVNEIKIVSGKDEDLRNAEILAYQTQLNAFKLKILQLEKNLKNAQSINEVVERSQYEKIKEISTLKKEKSQQEDMKAQELQELGSQISFLRKQSMDVKELSLKFGSDKVQMASQLEQALKTQENQRAQIKSLYELLDQRKVDLDLQIEKNWEIRRMNEQLTQRAKNKETDIFFTKDQYELQLQNIDTLERDRDSYKEICEQQQGQLQFQNSKLVEKINDMGELKDKYESVISKCVNLEEDVGYEDGQNEEN